MTKLSEFFHILNPSTRHRCAVRKFFRNIPADNYCWVERATHPTHLETIVEWAVCEKKNKIALWGGDGTFNRAVNELFRLQALGQVQVALIPAGTANDFARHMGWRSWKKTAAQAFSAEAVIRKVDLGLLKSGQIQRVFLNNAGFGRQPKAIGGGLSNPLNDILNFKEHKLQLTWKNDHAEHFETVRALLGIVFNAPFFNNGMYFDKAISPEDGLLNGFLVPPQRKGRLLWRFLKSRWGSSLNDARTFRLDAHTFEVESDTAMFPQVDGEKVVNFGVQSLRFEILKEALNIVIAN